MARYQWEHLILFVEQLSAAARLNLPLDKAIRVMSQETSDKNWRSAQEKIAELVRLGSPLSEALGNYPRFFPAPLQRMVKAAEQGQALPAMLRNSGRYLTFAREMQHRLQKCMIYPFLIWTVLLVDMAVVMLLVAPNYEKITAMSGQQASYVGQTIIQYGPVMATVVMGMLFYLAWLVVGSLGSLAEHRSGGSSFGETLAMRLPFLSAVQRHAKAGEVCEMLGVLTGAGRSGREAVAITKQAVENPALHQALDEVDAAIASGQDFEPQDPHTLVPPATLWMLAQTGGGEELAETLERLAQHHHRQMDLTASFVREFMEPVLLLAVAVMVTLMLLVFYLPLVNFIIPLITTTFTITS
ncbi:MAG: type II secretion system F family protein [Candidatus Hinthialibacter antarcticus]|nr:type II secretion system F family protein [Candidatus Hinthialibacter antarcticus]